MNANNKLALLSKYYLKAVFKYLFLESIQSLSVGKERNHISKIKYFLRKILR